MKYSLVFDTDSYKASHYLQYPPDTTSMFSYIESRGGKYPKTLMFGIQYYLKELLAHPVTVKDVEKAKLFFAAHGEPFNYDGWMYIAKELGGKLPIRIRAVPEGTVVPTGNILVSIESTANIPGIEKQVLFWLASWAETSLLRSVWYPTNVATISYTIKKIIMKALEESADDPTEEIKFKLHDFGSRGVSSQESAMIGGAAHLVNFMGSDTVVGVLCANEYYNCDMAGFSIPAAEHSSITSWGKPGEVDAYRNMLKQFGKPGAMFACVSDSYDIYNAITNLWGGELRQEVIDSGAVVVIRPDSGNPPDVVLKCVQLLDEKFGHTINTKGFKVLKNVRVIQGDGINEDSIQAILDALLSNNYSATNIAFGMGGALLQQHNRDTEKFALKCSHIARLVDGSFVEVDVYKDPVTDDGKRSKPGRLDLISTDGGKTFETVRLEDGEISHPLSVMRIVYEDGELPVEDDFAQVRARVA